MADLKVLRFQSYAPYWSSILSFLSMRYPEGETPLSKFPNVLAWHERMEKREAVQKTLKMKGEFMVRDGLNEKLLPSDTSVKEIVKKLEEGGAC